MRLTFKELQKRLGYGVAGITACLVSHEHQDHAKAAAQLLKKRRAGIHERGHGRCPQGRNGCGKTSSKAGDVRGSGTWTVVPFRTFHNTDEPLGFLIEDGRTKERLLWAVDTANLGVTADKLTYIAVECNYEERLLNRSDRIPSVLKDRIRHSHFEVSDVIRWLHKQDLSGVLTIWLLHLSAGNSRAEAWQRRFEREFPGIEIRICPE